MREWILAIVTLVAAGGSLVFLIISLKVKDEVKTSVENAVKPLMESVTALQGTVAGLQTQMAQQESKCLERYLTRKEWDNLEKMREKPIMDSKCIDQIREQNTRLEKNLDEVKDKLVELLKSEREREARD